MERQGLDLGLSLGLGLTTAATWPAAGFCLNSGMAEQEVIRRDDVVAAAAAEDERFACSPGSPVSSGSGKRGSGSGSGDEVDDAGCDVGGGGARKKLRLSKDQAAVLEECFKTHHTLTPVSFFSYPSPMVDWIGDGIESERMAWLNFLPLIHG